MSVVGAQQQCAVFTEGFGAAANMTAPDANANVPPDRRATGFPFVGHGAEVARTRAVAEATVIRVASWGRRSGRSKTENQRPFRGGDIHLRPSRPRPLLCDSAKTTTPSFTPSRASFSTTSLVEVVSSNTRMSR